MPKPYLIGGGIIVLLVVIIIVLAVGGKDKETQQVTTPKVNQDVADVIPTVSNSVQVEFEQQAGNKVSITVDGVPDGSESIDYELSYDTPDKGLQGVIGQLEITGTKASPEEEIFLGTCSSGTCIPHKVKGGIKVTLRFTGSYGEQLFEKDYDNEN